MAEGKNMAGYSARQSTYTTGDTIEDADTNDEFDALLAAFNASTGHTHDGSTAGDGALISNVAGGTAIAGNTIVFEGATADAFEATLSVTDPTADVTISLPDATDTLVGKATTDTLTNKTHTDPVLNGTLTGTAFLDEDAMGSNSAIAVASQQSIKAYVDAQLTAEDLDIAGDTGTDAIDLDSETLTLAGGTGITSVASSGTSTVTFNIDSTVATLTGSQTLTNKTLTSPTIDLSTVTSSGDLAVADGGTGASTLTDGGVLLGSGTGAVTAMAALADGEMIVGDGTTDPVAESGATLRTSIGLGTVATLDTGITSGLVPLVGTKSSTTTLAGLVERSTSAENVTGTDDTVTPTVAGVKEMIDTHGAPAGDGGVAMAIALG
jgi:hypothetical protein